MVLARSLDHGRLEVCLHREEEVEHREKDHGGSRQEVAASRVFWPGYDARLMDLDGCQSCLALYHQVCLAGRNLADPVHGHLVLDWENPNVGLQVGLRVGLAYGVVGDVNLDDLATSAEGGWL
ncbi:hypothetical protein LTR16_011120 [Cryomyces antarcticus]|uniref:Uncharacterized protein n=1 Tax=Cryomyces antarcticus TaxID=329879 RepID=A0ABR0LTU7_9PEZI|nr:hypothetical protein LTR16_011120 [Cryomyces antarcticus]